MALIRKAKGRGEDQSPSGYTRVVGDPQLGLLLSRVQSTVISAGTELERMIAERANRIDDFDSFITDLESREPGIFVATKQQVKKSRIIHTTPEPDLLAFDLRKRVCYVLEVKDGDTFDTKKSAGERESLHKFVTEVSPRLTFSFQVRVCGFNARDRKEIYDGLKHVFLMAELFTGRELCQLLGISFEDIVTTRACDQADNFAYFVDELSKIPSVEAAIRSRMSRINHIFSNG